MSMLNNQMVYVDLLDFSGGSLDKKIWRNWSAEFYMVQAMAVSRYILR